MRCKLSLTPSWRRSNSRRGIALLIALVALAVLVMIMAVVTWQGFASRRQLDRRENQFQSQWQARAGLELAAARLLADPAGYKGESVALIPRSEVRIEVQGVAGTAGVFRVTATARFPIDEPRPIERTLTRQFRRTVDGK